MKSTLILVSIVFIIFSSCKKSDSHPEADYIIKAGFACGWGSGEDSILISRTTIRYVYYIPAKSNDPVINKTRTVSESEWEGILKDFNMDDFVKLDYQSCNICVDGCDEWISIKKDQVSHEIRFSKGLNIDTISKLQTRLAQLRIEFSK
jgi:hypothetical protein